MIETIIIIANGLIGGIAVGTQGPIAGAMSQRVAAQRREALLVACLALVPLLPFLDKAFSVDAPVFVAVARHLIERGYTSSSRLGLQSRRLLLPL